MNFARQGAEARSNSCAGGPTKRTPALRAALTIDLHDTDRPEDIFACVAWLEARGLRATFFVPTRMLEEARFTRAFDAIDGGPHEIGTHAHRHDLTEVRALGAPRPTPSQLDFLDRGVALYEARFRRSPHAFRSPAWCYVSDAAASRLSRLGYTVDSSATPQRAGILSSQPFRSPWLFTPRSPHPRTPTLFEVPTSCLLFPLSRTALYLLRTWGILAFMELFVRETQLFPERPVVLQLHPNDLSPSAPDEPIHFAWTDVLPLPQRGFHARYWLMDTDRERAVARAARVLEELTSRGFVWHTLSEIRGLCLEGSRAT